MSLRTRSKAPTAACASALEPGFPPCNIHTRFIFTPTDRWVTESKTLKYVQFWRRSFSTETERRTRKQHHQSPSTIGGHRLWVGEKSRLQRKPYFSRVQFLNVYGPVHSSHVKDGDVTEALYRFLRVRFYTAVDGGSCAVRLLRWSFVVLSRNIRLL